MIEIIYYLDKNTSQINESEELEVFKSISNEEFQRDFMSITGKELDTKIFFCGETTSQCLENKEIVELLKNKGNSVLPIVTVNKKIVKKKSLLSVKELSNLLDMGFSIQYRP